MLKSVVAATFLSLCALLMVWTTPSQKVRMQVYMGSSLSPLLYVIFAVINVAELVATVCPRVVGYYHGLSTLTWLEHRLHPWMRQDATLALLQALETTTQVLQAYRISRFLRDSRVTYSPVWVCHNILQARFLLPTSHTDLAEKCILFAASLVNVRRLVVSAAKLPKSAVVAIAAPRLRVSVTREDLKTALHLDFRRKWVLKCFLLYQVLVGSAMLLAVVDVSFLRVPCPHGCVLETYPWFTKHCTCAYLRINCADPAFSQWDATAYLAPAVWGAHVFFLHISQCPLENGLDLRLLQPFTDIFAITIEFSNMLRWDAPPGVTWPPSLLGLNLRYGNLTTIPSVLYHLPPQLQALNIMGNKFQSIPPTVFQHWTTVTWLGLAEANLTGLPPEMSLMVNLERLILIGNQLSEIPEAWWTGFPMLQRYEMSNNQIKVLPPGLIAAKPKALIDLSNNPLVQVPHKALDRVAAGEILLDGTPYCTFVQPRGCRPTANRDCSYLDIGDNVCHMSCYNADCDWDGGDCTNMGSIFAPN
ncbi:hypothetical protein ACHHYP_05828 [Achlya hypogyna]|uniref:LNR domain-containing protein n=1 Tax=Achlya hypogyna TaxID=1202772 RepID=A0A1V9ZNH8_ACHHY|nr:hypothetical protein ACHHYP_05828 [Achlya hypogyna]